MPERQETDLLHKGILRGSGVEPAGQKCAPRFVVHRLVGAVGQAVDPVHAAAQLEAKPGAQVDGHRLALAERLAPEESE